jgi:hypothetical protein
LAKNKKKNDKRKIANALLAQLSNSGPTQLAPGVVIPAAQQLALPAPPKTNNVNTETSQTIYQSISSALLNPSLFGSIDPGILQGVLQGQSGTGVDFIIDAPGLALLTPVPDCPCNTP